MDQLYAVIPGRPVAARPCYPFSVASHDVVEQSLRSLAGSLESVDPPPGSVPERTILCVVPDLATAFWAELKDSRIQGLTVSEPTTHADVRITARSDDLVAMIEGRLSIAPALLSRRIRIDASPTDLLLLRRFF